MAKSWAATGSRPLAQGFTLLSAFTLGLIVLGALVRANGAGLACPDWPLCFGELVPRFDLKVAFEWSHRALAGAVSLGLLGLSLLAWQRTELRPWLRPRLLIVWSLLVLQVLLGGLTVLLQLVPWTVTLHLLLGNSFCLALLWIGLDLFEIEREPSPRPPLGRGVLALTAIAAICLGLQILLGGMVASYSAGLACAAFPTCDGDSVAPTLRGLTGLQVLHRLNGCALLGSFLLLAWASRSSGRIGLLARIAARLVILQIGIGAVAVLARLPIEVSALHTATAAAIVLVSALLAREVLLTRNGERRALSVAETG